jgi:hypothetical protein
VRYRSRSGSGTAKSAVGRYVPGKSRRDLEFLAPSLPYSRAYEPGHLLQGARNMIALEPSDRGTRSDRRPYGSGSGSRPIRFESRAALYAATGRGWFTPISGRRGRRRGRRWHGLQQRDDAGPRTHSADPVGAFRRGRRERRRWERATSRGRGDRGRQHNCGSGPSSSALTRERIECDSQTVGRFRLGLIGPHS